MWKIDGIQHRAVPPQISQAVRRAVRIQRVARHCQWAGVEAGGRSYHISRFPVSGGPGVAAGQQRGWLWEDEPEQRGEEDMG